jgi:hypothetical protein
VKTPSKRLVLILALVAVIVTSFAAAGEARESEMPLPASRS